MGVDAQEVEIGFGGDVQVMPEVVCKEPAERAFCLQGQGGAGEGAEMRPAEIWV